MFRPELPPHSRLENAAHLSGSHAQCIEKITQFAYITLHPGRRHHGVCQILIIGAWII
jgi:hypothetical protein